jgi:hypothetical protein
MKPQVLPLLRAAALPRAAALLRAAVLALAAAGAGYGADWEFDHLVKSIENHYGVKRTHIPLMGVANFVVKVARPAGTSGFKLAVFDDSRGVSSYQDQEDLDRFMEQVSSGGLHALVVTHSRREGESTYILAGEIGKTTKLLIATFERHEATIVEAQVNIATLLRAIGSPDEARNSYREER